MNPPQIHPLALVDPQAIIAEDVSIGPFCTVGPHVRIDSGTRLISHVTITGRTHMGHDNLIYPQACIGTPPQDPKYNGEDTAVIIGDHNLIREGVTIHSGTKNGRSETRIGNNNHLMAYAHVGHDCIVGSHCTLVNHVSLAGHVTLGDYVTLSGYVGVTQFVRIGSYTMIGAGSIVPLDVPPFILGKPKSNNRVEVNAVNRVGLSRAGFQRDEIASIDEAFRTLFKRQLTVKEAVAQIRSRGNPPPHVQSLIDFVESSTKGVAR